MLRQEMKLEFQVCAGELIHLVDWFPVLEDSIGGDCNAVEGVPTTPSEPVSFQARKGPGKSLDEMCLSSCFICSVYLLLLAQDLLYW